MVPAEKGPESAELFAGHALDDNPDVGFRPMKPPDHIFLQYPSSRDLVFILGAGASHPDGVPLQEHILPQILSGRNPEIAVSEIGKELRKFVCDNFYVNFDRGVYPGLEAVFGFLDYFLHQDESLSADYSHHRLRQIKENLIKAIHYVVNLNTDKHSPTYHRLWEAIQRLNRNVSIVTLNYDTLLEQSFDFLFRKYGYIDYCIPLMNDEPSERLTRYRFWINPRRPVWVMEGEAPAPYKILKLHGSLNWKYCNCCRQTLLTPWDRTIDLNRGTLIGRLHPEQETYDYACPIDGTDFQTLILPPSYIKTLGHPVISYLYGEAAREIRSTKRVVFVGYSLSDADVHIKALLKKNLSENAELVVINPKTSGELIRQYGGLGRHTVFVRSTFEALVNCAPDMEALLCGLQIR